MMPSWLFYSRVHSHVLDWIFASFIFVTSGFVNCCPTFPPPYFSLHCSRPTQRKIRFGSDKFQIYLENLSPTMMVLLHPWFIPTVRCRDGQLTSNLCITLPVLVFVWQVSFYVLRKPQYFSCQTVSRSNVFGVRDEGKAAHCTAHSETKEMQSGDGRNMRAGRKRVNYILIPMMVFGFLVVLQLCFYRQ